MGILNYLSRLPGQPWISSDDYPDFETRKPTAGEILRDLEHQLANVNSQLTQIDQDKRHLVSELVKLQERSDKLKAAEQDLKNQAADLAPKIAKAKDKAKAEAAKRRKERQAESAKAEAEKQAQRQAERRQRAEEQKRRDEAARKIQSGNISIEGDN